MNSVFKPRVLNNKFLCFLLLFMLGCAVKWFYLAHQNYYIGLSDEVPGGYHLARENSIIEIFNRILAGNYNLGSARPFFTILLYAIGFKIGGFHPYTTFYLSIIISSLLVPLYYVIIAKLLNTEVAILSSFLLLFMTNYIEQGIALSTILPGIIFLALSLFFSINYYRSSRPWKLFLSGCFLSISVLCRYENALFIPFFILYNISFDKKAPFYLKIIYLLISLSSAIYICLCSLKATGHAFSFIDTQASNDAFLLAFGGPIGFAKAISATKGALNRLLAWTIWISGAMGMFFVLARYKTKALIILSAFLTHLAFLFYKIENGTLWHDENYFLPLALLIIPLAFEWLRIATSAIFNRRIVRIFLGMVIGLLVFNFHNKDLILHERYRFPQDLIKITEDLKSIPENSLLYIGGGWGQFMLCYLKRDPILYFTEYNYLTKDRDFYILIEKDKIAGVEGFRKALVKDYNHLGLYEITNQNPD